MSDPQRTHKASPKRVKDFRKRGDIALSRDAVGAATLTGATIALLANAPATFSALAELTRTAMQTADGTRAAELPHVAMHAFIGTVLPPLLGATLGALLAIFGQLGWPPAWKGIGFDLTKLSPHKNLPNTFGVGAVARRTGMAIVKLVVVGAVVASVLGTSGFVAHALPADSLVALAGKLAARTMWAVVGTLVGIAAIDYLLARRRMATQMMMTSEELKREHKESEGDPRLKGKRRQKMRELAKRRLASAVAKADVVVVNPTHYAVALRYTEGKDRAPVVVAKGIDEVALRIKEIAKEKGIPVLERPPLARALHKHVKEGRTIPANLFKAVAEVLAYVYRLRRRR